MSTPIFSSGVKEETGTTGSVITNTVMDRYKELREEIKKEREESKNDFKDYKKEIVTMVSAVEIRTALIISLLGIGIGALASIDSGIGALVGFTMCMFLFGCTLLIISIIIAVSLVEEGRNKIIAISISGISGIFVLLGSFIILLKNFI